MNRLKANSRIRSIPGFTLCLLASLSLGFLLGACSEPPQDTVVETPENRLTTTPQDAVVVEKGMYFKPELNAFALHNESDDDGDGDGVNETHVRRYLNDRGDTAFSMTTSDRLWAWSLDSQGGDDTDIHKNYVIRDSNCDGVFDERYSLNAEFHVPACLSRDTTADQLEGM